MKVVFPGGKRADAIVNGFTIKTDQAVESGGDGSAPEPFTLFLASLVTCAGVYVLSFCQSRKLSTEGVYLTMRSEYDSDKRLVGKLVIDVVVPEGFPEKYHAALIRSAELCAVSRHIENALPAVEVGVVQRKAEKREVFL